MSESLSSKPIAPQRGFDPGEYQLRCAAVQQAMQAQGLDIIWLSTEADVRYFTGFLTPFWQSPTRPWYLLIPQSGKPVAIIPAIGALCMQRTWVEDIRTWSSPHPNDDGVSLMVDAIQSLAGNDAVVGLPMSAESWLRCPLNDWHRIQSLLQDVRWCDASACIQSIRQIKSAAEIDNLRYICAVTSDAFDRIPEIIQAGMSEVDVFRAFKIACLQAGADDPAYLVGAASTGGYEDIISPPRDIALAKGDILVLDTGCTFDGYYSDFNRNFAIEFADEATCDAHRLTWDVTEAGLESVKPGVSCAEVFEAMQKVMNKEDNADAGSVGRLGHGLGIQLTETPSIVAHDHTTLKAGMVMTLEPGHSYAAGKMMVHEENIVITDNGYELLSRRASRDIPVIGPL